MRVVCVQDLSCYLDLHPKGTKVPTVNKVYTIRDSWRSESGTLGFLLEEITNPIYSPTGREIGFIASAFRPLDESRLDQFRVHLNPKKVEEKINA